MKIATEILGALERKLSTARNELNQAEANLNAADAALDAADWAIIKSPAHISDAEYEALQKAQIDAEVKKIMCNNEFNRAKGALDAYETAVREVKNAIFDNELSERLNKMTAEQWLADCEKSLAQTAATA